MEYREAIIKVTDLARKDGTTSLIDLADALCQAYNAGRAAPPELTADERIVSAQSWQSYLCWLNDQKPDRTDRMIDVTREFVGNYCETHGLKVVPSECGMCVTDEVWNSLRADQTRMDFIANLADGRIYSATFSRANVCFGLTDGYGNPETLRECVDKAMKEASE